MTAEAARQAADQAARQSYGRLIAFLSARSRNIASAEDALSEAFRAALEHWPVSGVPASPEAWLLTAARRVLGKSARHARVEADAVPDLLHGIDEAINAMEAGPSEFADERLKLLFVCAHPAIDPDAQTPLMLQTVLGLDAARIAAAFMVPPATMSQRLVRAKARIRNTGIRFAVPDTPERPDRLEAVLQAIYAGYGTGWDDNAAVDGNDALDAEAIWLGRTLLALMPDEPEVMGLLALMLYCQSRKAARRAGDIYVPLSEQDVGLWDVKLITEADLLLVEAGRHNRFGRFQCEGAIQSVHAARRYSGATDRRALATLYRALVRLSPTTGARVGQAAASDPDLGLNLLHAINPTSVQNYQPYHAVRADLLRRLGRRQDAREAYARAIELTHDPQLRRFLLARMDEV